MTLLYRTAEWHAKLRLHTESTLQHLEQLTTELGQLNRKFRDTMQSAFLTFELPKEQRPERGARILARQGESNGKEKAMAGDASGKNSKHLNFSTYKWHALSDYVRAIHLFSPMDGFSTQVVSNLFPTQLSYSCFLDNRVNLLTKLLSACTDRQTSAMPSPKLLSAIEA